MLVPWAWAVNGCASVVSAVLAPLLAMELGFRGVVVSAVVLYALAAWALPGKPPLVGVDDRGCCSGGSAPPG
jgi:hypothetical protein